MFDRILIANRGEIACRVIRTARACGVSTVAVYATADAGAAHVAMADVAVCIGGSAPADSYLRGDVIVQAALDTGAQAIHPGYGFLSENPDFVDAVTAAGLAFIGPSSQAIRAMGLKDAAKALMIDAGVPVVPGYHGADQDPAVLAHEAAKIGYPVLIKAVAGGGGKGMRLVEAANDFQDALDSARSEAKTAFGNDAVLVEKYIQKPRHIEVQVFGDGTNALHLFERDCSLQRRHQKVIEEAPAPDMPADMRAAMGAAAVRAAESIGYSGAGTVEFIVDGTDGLRADGFWFMEMNTRLQVEHPVTEAITGVDLVEWQLRVAAGEPLPVSQSDLTISGHAFEARIYAEDVPAGFLPATGKLTCLEFPDATGSQPDVGQELGAGLRVDSGVRCGDVISPWYDPMIAKLIVHGPTRAIALRQLDHALRQTRIAGVVTNTSFLRLLAVQPDFVAGDVDTGLIARHIDALAAAPVACTKARSIAAMAALDLFDGLSDMRGFSMWSPLTRRVSLTHHDDNFEVSITVNGPDRLQVAGPDFEWDVTRRDDAWWIDGVRVQARVHRVDNDLTVFWGNGYRFTVQDPLARGTDTMVNPDLVDAPMPGLVKALFAEVGAVVSAGDRLAILEAMKMEHSLTAPRDGVIAEIMVQAGSQVDAGAVLLRLTEEPDKAG
jgi:3-methylcrotonyl-CoA carboxylase alpha subunit